MAKRREIQLAHAAPSAGRAFAIVLPPDEPERKGDRLYPERQPAGARLRNLRPDLVDVLESSHHHPSLQG